MGEGWPVVRAGGRIRLEILPHPRVLEEDISTAAAEPAAPLDAAAAARLRAQRAIAAA